MPPRARLKPQVKVTPWIRVRAAYDRLRRRFDAREQAKINAGRDLFKPPENIHPPSAVPEQSELKLAMDDNIISTLNWAQSAIQSVFSEGTTFLGYAYLSQLAQRVEYRRAVEIIAEEMTRKWIRLQSVNTDDDKTDRIKQLNDALDKFKARDHFRRIAEQDGLFGRAHLYIDTGSTEDRDELQTDIGNGRSETTRAKFGNKGGFLKGFRTVEAVWCYPTNYNSIDPLRDDWFRPDLWYVMGKQVHRSRLLKFVGREVPDMLKPAYSFGGLSLSQMIKPYVDNWLRTRQSIANIIHSFSVFVLKTNLASSLQSGGEDFFERLELFVTNRDNQDVMAIDKDTEDFGNVAVPLGSLDNLQSQTQEHICAAAGIPAIKYLNIQPAGFNACLIGDTLIETDQGYVPIRNVGAGHKVMTRNGWAPVAKAGCTGYTTELVEIETEESIVRCTADHQIWLPSISEFVPAKNVCRGDLLLYRGVIGSQNTANQSHIVAGFGGIEEMDTTLPRSFMGITCSIERFGEFITGLFQEAIKFTTSIKIRQIISLIISNYSAPRITQSSMARNPRGSLSLPRLSISANVTTAVSALLLWGNPRELNFAAIGAGSPSGVETSLHKPSRIRSVLALCAGYLLKRSEKTQNIVLENARPQARIVPYICPSTIGSILKDIKELSRSSITKGERSVVVSDVRRVPAQEFVYDIQVAPGYPPEFFANGICVHNSSEGEIRTFYDSILAAQERFFRPNLTIVIDFIMLNLWGEVDQEITYSFVPLWSLDEEKMSAKRKTEADTDTTLIDAGVISPAEARMRVAADQDSPYSSIDVDDLPEPPQPEGEPSSEGEPSEGGEKDDFAPEGGNGEAPAAASVSSLGMK